MDSFGTAHPGLSRSGIMIVTMLDKWISETAESKGLYSNHLKYLTIKS